MTLENQMVGKIGGEIATSNTSGNLCGAAYEAAFGPAQSLKFRGANSPKRRELQNRVTIIDEPNVGSQEPQLRAARLRDECSTSIPNGSGRKPAGESADKSSSMSTVSFPSCDLMAISQMLIALT